LPFYKILLCAEGIALPSGDGEPIVGFFATRIAFGKDAQIAGEKAKAMLLNEWGREGWSARNQGVDPVLNIQECWKVTFFNAMIKRASGFTFYR
jgi:hypothetical protein